MKSILELINEIRSQNLTDDELLERYNEMIKTESFYLDMINSEKNQREETEKERNLALIDENFRKNYSQYSEQKNMQRERTALSKMNQKELKSVITSIRTTGSFDTSGLTDPEKIHKTEERLNQRILENEQQQNSAVREFLTKKDGPVQSLENSETMTREKYERMSDEEKIKDYLEKASGRTEQDVTPAAKALSEMLQNGELRGPETKEQTLEKLNNGISCVVPYPIGTYLLKKENNKEHIDSVYKYVISSQGISVILLLDVLTNSRQSTEISLKKLINEWEIYDINYLDRKVGHVKTLKNNK